MKRYTLSFVAGEDKILLSMKKRGFGKGRWNGYGGKLEDGEDSIDAAIRETLEEIRIKPTKLERKGLLKFTFLETGKQLLVDVYRIMSYEGEPCETDEMRPKWFSISEIPYAEMWPDDQYWIPLYLEGKFFTGSFTFADDGNSVKDYDLNEVEILPQNL